MTEITPISLNNQDTLIANPTNLNVVRNNNGVRTITFSVAVGQRVDLAWTGVSSGNTDITSRAEGCNTRYSGTGGINTINHVRRNGRDYYTITTSGGSNERNYTITTGGTSYNVLLQTTPTQQSTSSGAQLQDTNRRLLDGIRLSTLTVASHDYPAGTGAIRFDAPTSVPILFEYQRDGGSGYSPFTLQGTGNFSETSHSLWSQGVGYLQRTTNGNTQTHGLAICSNFRGTIRVTMGGVSKIFRWPPEQQAIPQGAARTSQGQPPGAIARPIQQSITTPQSAVRTSQGQPPGAIARSVPLSAGFIREEDPVSSIQSGNVKHGPPPPSVTFRPWTVTPPTARTSTRRLLDNLQIYTPSGNTYGGAIRFDAPSDATIEFAYQPYGGSDYTPMSLVERNDRSGIAETNNSYWQNNIGYLQRARTSNMQTHGLGIHQGFRGRIRVTINGQSRIFHYSPPILPLGRSGDNQYLPHFNVFTNNTQDRNSHSSTPPTSLNITEYLDGLRTYMNSQYGSNYICELADLIRSGSASASIESHLITATSNLHNNDRLHTPLYRLGTNSGVNNTDGEFEFLVVTGGNDSDDARRFQFDAQVLRHAISSRYGRRCTSFQVLDRPTERAFEEQLAAAAERARRNGRRLYIVYRGHGTTNGYQSGIASSDQSLEGSRRYVFGFANYLSEDRFKALLARYLRDVPTTIIIGSCNSGAAITATDPFFRRTVDVI